MPDSQADHVVLSGERAALLFAEPRESTQHWAQDRAIARWVWWEHNVRSTVKG